MSREDLKTELLKTRLGKALAAGLMNEPLPPEPVDSYYTQPQTRPVATTSLKEFWLGQNSLPAIVDADARARVPGILVKKQGDFPPFWHQEHSFLEVMEELYERVRTKNRNVF